MTKYGTTMILTAGNGTETTARFVVRKESVPECITSDGRYYILALSDVLASKYEYREIVPVHLSELS